VTVGLVTELVGSRVELEAVFGPSKSETSLPKAPSKLPDDDEAAVAEGVVGSTAEGTLGEAEEADEVNDDCEDSGTLERPDGMTAPAATGVEPTTAVGDVVGVCRTGVPVLVVVVPSGNTIMMTGMTTTPEEDEEVDPSKPNKSGAPPRSPEVCLSVIVDPSSRRRW
jgi:hypothetical protein